MGTLPRCWFTEGKPEVLVQPRRHGDLEVFGERLQGAEPAQDGVDHAGVTRKDVLDDSHPFEGSGVGRRLADKPLVAAEQEPQAYLAG